MFVTLKKQAAVFSLLLLLLLTVLYFFFIKNHPVEKVPPATITDHTTPPENIVPLTPAPTTKETAAQPSKPEQHQPSAAPPAESKKIERPPSLPPASHENEINLQEQSYSIRNEKKDIQITPNIAIQPGQSINMKITGRDEVVRIERDKVYHPGAYNVLVEKKF